MNSVAERIKKELIKIISALSTINKVYSYEKNNPSGFPATFVTVTDQDGEFWTNVENRRSYHYKVLTLFEIGQHLADINDAEDSDLDQAEQAITNCVDEIINAVDSDFTLGDYALVLFVQASNTKYGYVQYEGGWARSAEVIIRVETEFNVT